MALLCHHEVIIASKHDTYNHKTVDPIIKFFDIHNEYIYLFRQHPEVTVRHININHFVMFSSKENEAVYLALFLNQIHIKLIKNYKTLVFFHLVT